MHVARARHAFSHMPSRPHVRLSLYLTASCRAWQACHAVFDNFLHAFARTRSSLNNARRAREARHEITYGCRKSARDDEKIARCAIVSRARICQEPDVTYMSNATVCVVQVKREFARTSEKKTCRREMNTHSSKDETRHSQPWLLRRRGAGDDDDDYYDNDDVDVDACY